MKTIGYLTLSLLLFLTVGCESSEVSANFFGEDEVLTNVSDSELIDKVNGRIENYESTLENVDEVQFIVKINGKEEENYEEFDEKIEEIDIDVYEYLFVYEEEVIKYSTIKIENENLVRGVERVTTEGKDGLNIINYTVVYKNGEEYETTDYMENVDGSFEAVNEVVEVGIDPIVSTQAGEYANLDECLSAIDVRIEKDKSEGVVATYVCKPSGANDGSYNIEFLQ